MKESLQVISLRGQDSWLSWQLARMPIAHWPHCSYLCLCLLIVFKHLFVLLLVWELYSSYHCHNISINMLASDHWHTARWVHLTSSLTHLSKAAAAELKNFLERHKNTLCILCFWAQMAPRRKICNTELILVKNWNIWVQTMAIAMHGSGCGTRISEIMFPNFCDTCEKYETRLLCRL